MCGQEENPPRVAVAPLVGPGKGRRTILCGLGCTYVEDNSTPCTCPNLIQHNTSNTPRSHNSTTADVETGLKLIENRGGEALREDVDELRCRRNMEYVDLTNDDSLSDKIKINLHMCVKTHLSVMMLEPRGWGTSSHVPLLIRAPYSSSIATRQFGLTRATWTEVGVAKGGDEEAVATRVSQS
jgi:hypothetical protein